MVVRTVAKFNGDALGLDGRRHKNAGRNHGHQQKFVLYHTQLNRARSTQHMGLIAPRKGIRPRSEVAGRGEGEFI